MIPRSRLRRWITVYHCHARVIEITHPLWRFSERVSSSMGTVQTPSDSFVEIYRRHFPEVAVFCRVGLPGFWRRNCSEICSMWGVFASVWYIFIFYSYIRMSLLGLAVLVWVMVTCHSFWKYTVWWDMGWWWFGGTHGDLMLSSCRYNCTVCQFDCAVVWR